MFKDKQEVDQFLDTLIFPYLSPIVKREKSGIAAIGIVAQRDIEEGEILVVNIGTLVDAEVIKGISHYYECENLLCVGFGKYIANKPFATDGTGQ